MTSGGPPARLACASATPCCPGSTATAEDIRAHCRQHLADFKVPEFVEFVDAPLPRNPAGKVLKNILRGGQSAFAPSESDDSAL